ncbi:MAG TPA: DUF1476 domain-containing protein [Bradyrhizobium sp.]|nr:DUF1476 domain-containing protein [Bradyrhizobium sp.]
MTTFDDRENAYELEFAHQEEVRFKVRERAVRELARWAAEKMNKTGKEGESYANDIVGNDIVSEKSQLTIDRIATDLKAAGISEQEVGEKMNQLMVKAEAAIRGSTS